MTLYQERNKAILKVLIENNIVSVLDCGCGNGRLLNFLAESNKFQKLAGLDNSIKQIQRAQKCNANNNIEFFHQSIFSLSSIYDLNSFDAVVASEIIEHFSKEELNEFFRIIFQVLSPKIVIITTPNKEYNCNYEKLYNGLRHSSHKFEFDKLQVIEFVNSITKKYPEYSGIYDFCDRNCSSHLIVFKRG